MNKLKCFILSLLIPAATLGATASINVQAQLDSVNLQMGRITTLHLTVTQPENVKGSLPLFKEIRENGIVPVCGDSVEFRAPSKIDTVRNGSSLTIKYDIPVQAFDSGRYKLPEIEFVAGTDTARSKALTISVIPVKAEADTPISDYASTSEPENPSIFDHVPDWIYDYWWILLLLLAAIAIFIYALRKYRAQGHILPRKPQPTPYETALSALRQLKEKKLWEQGMEKEYYSDLTEILRKYLEGRFGINAMEMTSRQILHALAENKEISEKKTVIRQILDMADFVKFAKVRPLPEDNVKTYDNALQFVKDTKPLPPPTEEKSGKPAKPSKPSKQSRKKGGRK